MSISCRPKTRRHSRRISTPLPQRCTTEAGNSLCVTTAPACCCRRGARAWSRPARTRTMHKTLLNFVSEGAWSDEAVLAAMRSQVLPAMQAHGPLRFWIVDESGMPKKGKHSVGVARQYCGEVGKVDNCQVLVSLSVANEAACLPLAARLYLPEAWAVDEERRSKVGVPLDVVFQSKPAIALEQIRAAHAAGVPPGVVLADEVYGSTASFRQGVSALGLAYAAAVRATTPVRRPLDKRRARLWRGQDAA